jgi:hypothetical protein
MGDTSAQPDDRRSDMVVAGSGRRTVVRRRLAVLALLMAAAGCYAGIVAVRHGPPPGGDTPPLTAVTTAIADGDFAVAASVTSLPDPPGFPLMAAPFVALFRGAVGSPDWCTPSSRVVVPLRGGVPPARGTVGITECGTHAGPAGVSLPPWYRAQGILGVASWLVLALGALALLRAGGADSLPRQAGLLTFLAFLPAASSAIVQLYHPQDIVSLGLALAGLSQSIRGRWALAGALLGAALLSKQFALLLLLPALVIAPGRRPRLVLAGSAAALAAIGLLPFVVADPRATLENLSGFGGGGALPGQTVLTLVGVHGTNASAVARDAPVVFAVAVCIWAAGRHIRWVGRPAAVVALALVCTGSRLVFESVVFPYYLLSASVLVLLVDLVARRSPHRSLAWCAAAAFFVAVHPGNRAVAALGTLVLAVAVVAIGFADLHGPSDRGVPSDGNDPAREIV